MVSPSERGNSILIGGEGHSTARQATTNGGEFSGDWPQTGGSGKLTRIGFPRQSDSDQNIPRSVEAGESRVLVADLTCSASPSAKQMPFTGGLNYIEDWGGDHVYYPMKDGVFNGGLGFGSWELSTGLSIPFSDLIKVASIERPNVLTEGFNSPLIYFPSDFLVDGKQGSNQGPGVSTSGEDFSLPTDNVLEKKGFLPAITPQRGERMTKEMINTEGHHTKVVRCA